jgi:hypothetical protein
MGRREHPNARPFKFERVGHPEKLNQSLSDEVLKWYHPDMRVSQQKKEKGCATRPRVGFPFVP